MSPELISLIGNEIIAVMFAGAAAVVLVRFATILLRAIFED